MTTRAPSVSIGLPVYNGERWVASTIESVLAQTHGDIELVVSDNASTDGTEAVCRDYERRDRRVRYERSPENVGLAGNFTRCFRLARAPYFKWTSCSDLIAPTYVERCMEVMTARPDVALTYTGVRLFEADPADGRDSHDDFDLDVPDPVARFLRYEHGVKLNNIMHGVYRSRVLGTTRLYRKFYSADVNLIAAVVLRGRVVQLREVLHYRRMQPDTYSGYLSGVEQARLYSPKASSLRMQRWQRLLDYCHVVLNAPLSFGQRMRLLRHVGRSARWSHRELTAELFELVRWPRSGQEQR